MGLKHPHNKQTKEIVCKLRLKREKSRMPALPVTSCKAKFSKTQCEISPL